jgi:hypothetical protein
VSSFPNLRGEGLWPLLSQGRLTQLYICGTPTLFTSWELSRPLDKQRHSYSSKLKYLQTNQLAGVLTRPICSLLSSSLTTLTFATDHYVERCTNEQEDALHLLKSLQELTFWDCKNLQHLPAGLSNLTNLKRFQIRGCPAIQILSMDGLPSSLQELVITSCPAIKSLPKDGLPSSLRELHLRGDINEQLKRQCRKLRGTIPIIKDCEEGKRHLLVCTINLHYFS